MLSHVVPNLGHFHGHCEIDGAGHLRNASHDAVSKLLFTPWWSCQGVAFLDLSVYMYLCMYIYISIYLSIYLSICMGVCICMYVYVININ